MPKIRGNSFLFAPMLVWTLLRSVAVSEQGTDAVPELSAPGQAPGMPLSTPGSGGSPRRLAHGDTSGEGMGWAGRITIGVLVLTFVVLGSVFVFRRVFVRVR